MKKLIPAICMLIVAATLLGTSTYAWFSMNRQVEATGMKVKATASQALVISQTAPVGSNIAEKFTVSSAAELAPATHCDSSATISKMLSSGEIDSTGTTTTNLKYVINNDKVNPYTGKENSSATLIYADGSNGTNAYGVNDGKNTYYVDYVVFIAVSGNTAMTGKTLNIKFDDETKKTMLGYSKDRDTKNAVAIDFYVENINDATTALDLNNYKGTLWLGKSTEELVVASTNIPLNNTTSDLLRVTMRVYLDGEYGVQSGVEKEEVTRYDSSKAKYYEKIVASDGTPSFNEIPSVTKDTFNSLLGTYKHIYVDYSASDYYVYTDFVDVTDVEFGVFFSVAD